MPATFHWTFRYGSSASNKVVGYPGGTYQSETKESGMGSNGAVDRLDLISIDTGESIGGNPANGRVLYSDYPIRAGENSMEKWVRGKWDFEAGVTNKISGVKFWLSTPTTAQNLANAVRIHAICTGTYTTPTGGTSDGVIGADGAGNLLAANVSSTPPAGALAVTFSGNTAAAELTASNYSNYIVLQLRTETSASPGNTNNGAAWQFTLQYDES